MPALRSAPPPLGLESIVYRFPAMRRGASSSAASWMSNAARLQLFQLLEELETSGTAPPEEVAKINEGEGVLARANVEVVSAAVRFCGQVQLSGPQGVSRLGLWGGLDGKALVSLSRELLDLSATRSRPLNLPGGF